MTLDAAIALIDQPKTVFERDNTLQTLVNDARRDGCEPATIYAKEFELECRVKLAEACHHFARHGEWPLLPPSQQLLIYERLKAAREFLWVLHNAQIAYHGSPIQIASEADRSSLLSFLLVDYWAMLGADIMQSRRLR
jgi:hypothetical protein